MLLKLKGKGILNVKEGTNVGETGWQDGRIVGWQDSKSEEGTELGGGASHPMHCQQTKGPKHLDWKS